MTVGKSIVIYIVCMIVIAVALALIWTGAADAHGWYDPECCGEQDCKPVADGVVNDANDSGVDVQGFGHIGPKDSRLRMSLDVHDHLCIHTYAESQRLICVYHVRRGF
jgi:hypothetical protein